MDISDMLFIVGHVGHIWRSWETKLYETITKSKVFEVQSFWEQICLGRYWDFFWDQNFRDRYWDFFWDKNFQTNIETFFETKYFWDRYRDFFWDPNFRDWYRDFVLRPKCSRPIPRLFLRPNIFEADTETFLETNFLETDTGTLKKMRKVSILRSLGTRCHTLLFTQRRLSMLLWNRNILSQRFQSHLTKTSIILKGQKKGNC